MTEDSCCRSLTLYPKCNYVHCSSRFGHRADVHLTTDFSERYALIHQLGWKPFRHWFVEPDFRQWWQLNSLTGVPLYKIYLTKEHQFKVWRTWTDEKFKKKAQLWKITPINVSLSKENVKKLFTENYIDSETKKANELLIYLNRLKNMSPLQRYFATSNTVLAPTTLICVLATVQLFLPWMVPTT